MNYNTPWQQAIADPNEVRRQMQRDKYMAVPKEVVIPESAIAYRARADFKPQPTVVNPDMMCTCGYRARVHARNGSGACEIAGSHCNRFQLAEEQDAG